MSCSSHCFGQTSYCTLGQRCVPRTLEHEFHVIGQGSLSGEPSRWGRRIWIWKLNWQEGAHLSFLQRVCPMSIALVAVELFVTRMYLRKKPYNRRSRNSENRRLTPNPIQLRDEFYKPCRKSLSARPPSPEFMTSSNEAPRSAIIPPRTLSSCLCQPSSTQYPPAVFDSSHSVGSRFGNQQKGWKRKIASESEEEESFLRDPEDFYDSLNCFTSPS